MAKRVSYVKFDLDEGATVKVVANLGNQAAYRMAQKMRGRVITNIHSSGRIDTGKMLSQLQVRKDDPIDPLIVGYTVSSSAVSERDGFPYPIVQERGSRDHGPKRSPFMQFYSKPRGHIIRVKFVRGVKAGNFFKDALGATRAADAAP